MSVPVSNINLFLRIHQDIEVLNFQWVGKIVEYLKYICQKKISKVNMFRKYWQKRKKLPSEKLSPVEAFPLCH